LDVEKVLGLLGDLGGDVDDGNTGRVVADLGSPVNNRVLHGRPLKVLDIVRHKRLLVDQLQRRQLVNVDAPRAEACDKL